MDASRRRTYDIPKSESGLAEWTSKIKALQRQVDEDEEVETKRLEEEIRASRMTRMRRSTIQSRPSSFDLYLSEAKSQNSFRVASPPCDVEESTEDKQKNQEATLRRLMGQRSPAATEFPRDPPPLVSASPKTVTGFKPEPISLAAFMGSSATGPRLNKHAPQPNAHDPEKYDQPSKILAPHPVFGKGGVAMPGMSPAAGPSISKPRASPSINVQEALPLPAPTRERKISTPSVARRYVEKVERENTTAPKAGGFPRGNIRERTMSTPIGPGTFRNTLSPKPPSVEPKPDFSRSPITQPSLPEGRPVTSPSRGVPIQEPPTVTLSPSQALPRQLVSPTSASSTPRKPSVFAPPLGRPVHPNQKQAFPNPQIVSPNPSPAFLKPSPPKDVTPSISRLQGRGFVQSMIKVSSQFEAAASTASPPHTPEKGNGHDTKKPLSVLDRWPASSTTAQQVISPQSVPMRKTRIFEPSNPTTPTPPIVASKPIPSPIPKLKSQHTTPFMASSPTPTLPSSPPPLKKYQSTANVDKAAVRTPGLGSSNTLVSYIKPTQTGDSPPLAASKSKPQVKAVRPTAPPTIPRTKTPVGDVDELGLRKNFGKLGGDVGKSALSSPRPPPSAVSSPGQPLSHPTKDRAKKPKKMKPTGSTARPSTPPQPTKPPPIPSASIPLQRLESRQDREQTRSLSPTKATAATPSNRPPLQSNNPKVTDKWGNQPVIGVKPMLNGRGGPPIKQVKPEHNGMVGRMALPGLAIAPSPSEKTSVPKEEKSSRPSTPIRTRIPSTGNRATVMDVAQAWSEHRKESSIEASISSPHVLPHTDPDEEEPPAKDVNTAIANRGVGTRNLSPPSPTSPSAEKRKSSLEKYSALVMPALKEERSPIPTPASTMRNGVISPVLATLNVREDEAVKKVDVKHSPIDVLHTSLNSEPGVVNMKGDDLVHFDNYPEPLPEVDVDALLNVKQRKYISDPNARTVSVDVMSVIGSASTAVVKDVNVFYDNEILAIIHRFKVMSSGLVETKVWGWFGKNSEVGEREEKTLAELARRYGTKLIPVKQYREPTELVSILGGQLAVRQGSRVHWSSENTAMHLVRVLNGAIFIDEQDLSVRNLCSGFSYCLSILGTFYVWHGCGSRPPERKAALAYAHGLSGNTENVIELNEGQNDDDDIFWMMLGDKDYAQAQYWKWRPDTGEVDPQVWKVDSRAKDQICLTPSLLEETSLDESVFILDCIWESFVLVGSGARGNRQDIRLALAAAMGISARSATLKPFAPTVHVLILPTQLPLDLRLNIRGINEEQINHGNIPEHMNILPAAQALEHLERSRWDKGALKDKTILPLGLHETDLS